VSQSAEIRGTMPIECAFSCWVRRGTTSGQKNETIEPKVTRLSFEPGIAAVS